MTSVQLILFLIHLSNLIQQKYDDKGKIAASGKLNLDLFRHLQSLEYYKLKSPKSLGVEWVNDIIFPILSEYSRLSVMIYYIHSQIILPSKFQIILILIVKF